MHKNCDVALFLVLCLIMRRKFIGGSDQKLLEISASNVAPILNVSKRLFIANPISHTTCIDVRANATLAAIIDHPVLRHFVSGQWREVIPRNLLHDLGIEVQDSLPGTLQSLTICR